MFLLLTMKSKAAHINDSDKPAEGELTLNFTEFKTTLCLTNLVGHLIQPCVN